MPKSNQDDNGWEEPQRPGVKNNAEEFTYTPEKDEEETSEADIEVVVEDEQDEKEKQVQQKPKKEGGRAEKRIRQLARKNNDLGNQLSAAQEEIANLKRGTLTIQKNEAERSVSQYQTTIDAKKAALKQAKLTGDLDAEMSIEDELRDLTISKRIAEANKEKYSKVDTTEDNSRTKPAQQTTNTTKPGVDRSNMPQKTQEWLDDNEWFDTNPKMQVYSAAFAQDLLNEGLSFEEDEFYERMDEEMRVRFPEQFVTSGDDDVQLKNKAQSSSKSEDVKRRQQVVPGSSRTPVVKKGREVLTREEAATADRLGIPRERYAARKKAERETRETSGWVTIGRAK